MRVNHIQKGKKIGATFLVILTVSILTLTIAYAALSETLTISGSGTVNASNWDINIKNSSSYTNSKTGTATYTTPTVSGTTINYTVSLTKPGDSITLYFDVTNDGDVNGEISSIINSTPTCISSTGNTTDASLVCDNLDISFIYQDGTAISAGDIINQSNYTCINGTNSSYNMTYLKLVVKLKDNMTSVPTSQVTVSNLKHEIIYTLTTKQCDVNSCFVAGTKIATKNGYKNIENIKENDYVYTIDLDSNKKELKRVVDTFFRPVNEVYEIEVNGEKMYSTGLHPYYVIDKGWINAYKLKEHEKLYSSKNYFALLKNIRRVYYDKPVIVYNFEVEENHNYLVTKNEILVHNAGGGSTSGGSG